jgi:FkbM family methyltransferase
MSSTIFRRAYTKLLTVTGLRHPLFPENAWNNIKRMAVGPLLLKVEEFDGEFYIDPRSDLFARLVSYGIYEPEVASFIKRFVVKDKDAIDIGANIGFFTHLLANSCGSGRVLACEPTINAGNLLERNIAHNHLSNVTVFRGAVSDAIGELTLSFVEGHEEYSSIGSIEHNNARDWTHKQLTVPTKTVDALVDEYGLKPGIIKVDVEGAENLVFRGALKTLKTHRPVVVSELDHRLLGRKGTSIEAVIEMFKSVDYDVVDPYMDKWQNGVLNHNEVLAIPKELVVAERA